MGIQAKLANFTLVTVMRPVFYESDGNGGKGAELFTLESLRISNFTQEGPTKTAKGGFNANTILRYGKTMRLEMEDVIGKEAALTSLMGVEYVAGAGATSSVSATETFEALAGQTIFTLANVMDGTIGDATVLVDGAVATTPAKVGANAISVSDVLAGGEIVSVTYNHIIQAGEKYSITNKFATPKYIEGTTYVIDPSDGSKQWIQVHVPSFLPDSLYSFTMEAEGDFGVLAIAGEVQANDCGEFMWFGDETNHTC